MRRRHLALGRRRRRLRLGGGRGGGGRGGREFAHDTLVLLLPFLFHLLELGLAHHRVEAGAEVARHALGLARSEEQTSELQSLMRISYAVFCLKKKKKQTKHNKI